MFQISLNLKILHQKTAEIFQLFSFFKNFLKISLYKWETLCYNSFVAKRGNVKSGGVAQLGEHLPCKQGVRSSTLLISTKEAY